MPRVYNKELMITMNAYKIQKHYFKMVIGNNRHLSVISHFCNSEGHISHYGKSAKTSAPQVYWTLMTSLSVTKYYDEWSKSDFRSSQYEISKVIHSSYDKQVVLDFIYAPYAIPYHNALRRVWPMLIKLIGVFIMHFKWK